MESFKAANPGCVLADFVRWHSPRDWDQDKCKLSPRMEIEGNIWKEAWDNAKPVPAKRQRRLFDDTREAEKVLQYLTNLKPSEAAHLLMPVLEHAAVVRISKEANESIIGIFSILWIEIICRRAIESLNRILLQNWQTKINLHSAPIL